MIARQMRRSESPLTASPGQSWQAELDLIGQTSVHCAKVLAARAQEEELKSDISKPGVFGKA
jgi:hypothetical protein